MSTIHYLLLFLSLLTHLTSSKVVSCKDKFMRQEFSYCAKFAVPQSQQAFVSMRARITSTYLKKGQQDGISELRVSLLAFTD